jgi:hypothetical protein
MKMVVVVPRECAQEDEEVWDHGLITNENATFRLVGCRALVVKAQVSGQIKLRCTIQSSGLVFSVSEIESKAFPDPSLVSIVLPRTVEVLGTHGFSNLHSFSLISFESNSMLNRIEQCTFFNSFLKSMIIPRTVAIIDGSAFTGCQNLSLGLEEGNEHFVVEGDFLLDFEGQFLIHYFGNSKTVCIANGVRVLSPWCFSSCSSLSSISFESDSMLTRIESFAFLNCSLQSIVIPKTVETSSDSAFARCRGLSIRIEEGNKYFIVEKFLV